MPDPDFPSLKARVWNAVRTELKNAPGCHDFAHTERVVRNALLIAGKEHPQNPEAVLIGALLHDIARPEELSSGGKLCHAAAGAKKAARVLRENGCENEAFIRTVSEIVRRHRYRGSALPQTLEEKIVYDADKLDSLGAFGVARAFHFAGRIGARLHNSEQAAVRSEAYSREDSAYREYLTKLRHLPDRMLTAAGKALAVERADFMKRFFEQLNRESVFCGEEEDGTEMNSVSVRKEKS